MNKKLISISIYLVFTSSASAYIGPGMGAGIFAVIFGILAAIFLSLVAIIWYPIKRLLSRIKKNKSNKVKFQLKIQI